MGVDDSLVTFLADHRVPVLNRLSRGAMAVGTNPVVIIIVIVAGAVYMVRRRQWRLACAVALAFVMSVLVTGGLKVWIDRSRPPAHLALVQVAGPSMPSTHAAWTAAVAVVVLLMVEWRWPRVRLAVAVGLLLAVVGIGAALVYLGVHWPTDVLAGWLLGAIVGALIVWSVTCLARARRPSAP